MPNIDPILSELGHEAKITQRVLDRIPDGKLAWKPHTKSSSLGQLGMHIAHNQGFLAEALQVDTFEFGNFTQAEPVSRKEILDAFTQSTETARKFLAKLDDLRLMATWTGTLNGKVVVAIPRIAFIRSVILNHTYHHRGQLSVYLRLLDIPVPSIYGPSADEKPA